MIIFLSVFMLFSFHFYESKRELKCRIASAGKETIYLLKSKLAEVCCLSQLSFLACH